MPNLPKSYLTNVSFTSSLQRIIVLRAEIAEWAVRAGWAKMADLAMRAGWAEMAELAGSELKTANMSLKRMGFDL